MPFTLHLHLALWEEYLKDLHYYSKDVNLLHYYNNTVYEIKRERSGENRETVKRQRDRETAADFANVLYS